MTRCRGCDATLPKDAVGIHWCSLCHIARTLTPRQAEVLQAYASVPDETVPHSISRWLNEKPTHQVWGCRINGLCNVLRRLHRAGLVILAPSEPTIHAVHVTETGHAVVRRLRGGKVSAED